MTDDAPVKTEKGNILPQEVWVTFWNIYDGEQVYLGGVSDKPWEPDYDAPITEYADNVKYVPAFRIAELEAANRGLVRLNEATEARAEAAEAQVAKLVEYHAASEAMLSIEAEWRSRKIDGLLDGPNILNLTDKLTATEVRLTKARAALSAVKREATNE